jgi:hypothetical protein
MVKITVFWVVAPYSVVEVDRITLMIETARASEMSVNFYQSTRRNKPEGSRLQKKCLKSAFYEATPSKIHVQTSSRQKEG